MGLRCRGRFRFRRHRRHLDLQRDLTRTIQGGIGYTGSKRFARLPDVPTLAEAGVPGMEVLSSWTGMFAPARTPAAVLARLSDEIRKATSAAEYRDRLTTIGLIPVGKPAEFKPFVADQVRQVAEIVRAAGIEPE